MVDPDPQIDPIDFLRATIGTTLAAEYGLHLQDTIETQDDGIITTGCPLVDDPFIFGVIDDSI